MRLPSTVTILPGTPISPPKMLLLVSNRPSKMLLLVSIRPSRLVTFGLESLTRMAFVGRSLPSGFVCCDHGQSCSVDFHSCLAMSGSTFFYAKAPFVCVDVSDWSTVRDYALCWNWEVFPSLLPDEGKRCLPQRCRGA